MSISGNRKDRPVFDDADFLVPLAESDGASGPPSAVEVAELRGTTPVVDLESSDRTSGRTVLVT